MWVFCSLFMLYLLFLFLLSTFTLPSWMLSLKKSFTEQPARPEDAHAQAHAQDEAQAHDEAQDDAHDDAQDDRCEDPDDLLEELLLTGTFITFTCM